MSSAMIQMPATATTVFQRSCWAWRFDCSWVFSSSRLSEKLRSISRSVSNRARRAPA